MFSASKTAAPVSGAYQISNSVRFRSAASAYLSRTPSVAGNRQTWTWSAWFKRGNLGSRCSLFSSGSGATGSLENIIQFETTNNLTYFDISQNTAVYSNLQTAQVFRDPSAWYHIVVLVDTTQATASNRIKIYINGIQVTSFTSSTYPSQNFSTAVNSIAPHQIANIVGASENFDGYLADINFIDGQALTPSSFGQINPTTGVWQPAKYTGSYGTNGFHLAFNNGTSTTTLGNDSSGNGNNWTPNNISLTAGSTYDWMLDSPTPYAGTSYGVGNYAVANPLDKGSDITASDGNLSVSWGGVNGHSIRDSIAMSAGQWYCELTMGTSSVTMGLIAQNISGVGSGSGWPGSSTFGVSGSYGYANSGNKYTNSTSTAYGASYTTGDVIGIAFDATAGTLAFYKNGASQGTAFTGISGAYCFAIGYFGGSTGGTPAYANFGQRPFAYTPPSGYKSLCTYNLPTPTIQNGAAHMAATLYTGTLLSNAVSNAVNGVSFKPDFVWIKSRSAATDHKLTDSVRGTTKALVSDSTAAETTDSQGLTTFGPSGFTVGTDIVYNNLAATYVAWQWKAGGTAVTNTAGSITSQVSANTTAGFSVVTYTGTGANATVGHGLGIAPSMVIIKDRGAANLWVVYHASLGATGYLSLNSTAAFATLSSVFNNTAPTSSVISLGVASGTNNPSMVAYCFAAIAGYSAFGSYTGNASTDGVFVYCGFQPKFVLIKCSSTNVNWYIFDSARNTYNVLGEQLYPNLSNAGSTVTTLDILSNGFKMRISTDPNASATYVYAAFASSPFQNSLAF